MFETNSRKDSFRFVVVSLIVLCVASWTTLVTQSHSASVFDADCPQCFNSVDAQDGHFLIANAPVSSSSLPDSMLANTVVSGERRWGLSIFNHYDQTLTNAKIAFSTTLGPSDFDSGLIPSGVSVPSLASNTNLSEELRLSSTAPASLTTFTPGFDSSRAVSPLVIPAGVMGAFQNVTIKVTPRDTRYSTNLHDPPSGVQLFLEGNVIGSVNVTPLTPGVESWSSGCGNFCALNNPQLNTEYTFTAVISVDNPAPTPVVNKPRVGVMMIAFGQNFASTATSASISDPSLGGNIVFSMDQTVSWNANTQENFQIGYGPVNDIATDTTPPVITVPGNMIAEATSPRGAVVSFTASATDAVDGSVPVTCSSASGSTFPLGATTVTCLATDQAGNSANASFTVTVVDTTPPTINCPANITAYQDSAFGAVVKFSVIANDTASAFAVNCSPSSGSNFVLGSTTVKCMATDASSNSSSCSFTVTVVPPVSTVGVKSTDGGSIPIPGGTGTFGIVAMASSLGMAQGNVEYQDHVTGMNVKSTAITAIVVSGTHARIFGAATINGSGSYNFVVDVDDFGEPGIGSDTFGIQVSNGYSAGPAKLSGGNIQIHN